ncbi:MAG: serine hydrolase domain-containing protein, partial [Allorhizobium sp.]
MQFLVKWVIRVLLALAAVVVVATGWILVFPPELLRVGTGYAAKIVCSNVFIAGRDADEVLREDVQAPGHPLLKLVAADVDIEGGVVRTAMLGMVAPSYAVHRAGLGCANVDETQISAVREQAAPVPDGA